MKKVNIAVVGAGKRSGPGGWLPLSEYPFTEARYPFSTDRAPYSGTGMQRGRLIKTTCGADPRNAATTAQGCTGDSGETLLRSGECNCHAHCRCGSPLFRGDNSPGARELGGQERKPLEAEVLGALARA